MSKCPGNLPCTEMFESSSESFGIAIYVQIWGKRVEVTSAKVLRQLGIIFINLEQNWIFPHLWARVAIITIMLLGLVYG